MKLKDMTVAAQMRLAPGVMLALLLALAVLAIVQTENLWQRTRTLYDHSLVVRRAVGDFQAAALTMRIAMRDFNLAGNETGRRGALENLAAAEDDARRQLDILQARYTGPAADIDELRRALARWSGLQGDALSQIQAGRAAAVLDRIRETGDIGLARGRLMNQLDKISDLSRRNADRLFAESAALKEAQLRQAAAAGFCALLLALFLSWRLIRAVRDPLREIGRAMERFRRGEREARSGYVSANEFGRLSGGFNEMAATLETQGTINEQAAQLAGVMLRESEARTFCREVLKTLMTHTNSQIGAFYLLNEQKTAFEPFESIGLSADRRACFAADLREGEFGPALVAGRMQRITDIPADTAFSLAAVSGELRPREILTLPLQAAGETIAVISLAKVSAYEEQALQLLDLVSATAAARLSGVLSFRRIRHLAKRLDEQNRELDAQKQELIRQGAELDAMNRELDMQNRSLEEASRLKSAFLSNMSHELRTPLNSVLALSRVLVMQAGERLSPDELDYVEIIERNGRNLLDLINDLLDLAKIEAGRMDVRPAPFSPVQALENVLEMLAPLAGEQNIELRREIPEDLPIIESDEIRVNQILQNLIGNAVKFTDAGSVTVSAASDGGRIRIRIADTGIGIAPEDLPHIFDEFRQVDGSSARRHGGTGLGLAIARKTACMLYGDIAVESTPGEGSVFTLTLPLVWPEEAPAAPEAAFLYACRPGPDREPGLPPGGGAVLPADGPRILLVEDNEAAVIQVRSVLEGAGYLVDVARGGQEARDFLAHTVPDGIVLDLMMPEVDGFAVLESLRSLPATASVPVLILTAKEMDRNDLKRLKANHVRQIVQKGNVDPEGLLSGVASLMKRP